MQELRTNQALPRVGVLTARHSQRDVARYFQFAAVAQITLLRLGAADEPAGEREFHPTLREVVVPRSAQHLETERAVATNIPFDLSVALLVRLLSSTPQYGEALRELGERIDYCLVAESALGDVAAATLRVPLVYDAPRIEACVPFVDVRGTAVGTILADLKVAEARLCEAALSVIVRGDDDARALRDTAGYAAQPAIVPTGVPHDAARYRTAAQRQAAKAAMGLSGRTIALFENDASVESISGLLRLCEIARRLPGVLFFVSGPSASGEHPPNLRMLGSLTYPEVVAVRDIADLAIVPYETACGTTPQVVDFILAGIPLVATPAALRNVPLIAERDVLSGSLDALPSLVTQLLDDTQTAEARSVSALIALLAAAPPTLTALNFRSFNEQLSAALATPA